VQEQDRSFWSRDWFRDQEHGLETTLLWSYAVAIFSSHQFSSVQLTIALVP